MMRPQSPQAARRPDHRIDVVEAMIRHQDESSDRQLAEAIIAVLDALAGPGTVDVTIDEMARPMVVTRFLSAARGDRP